MSKVWTTSFSWSIHAARFLLGNPKQKRWECMGTNGRRLVLKHIDNINWLVVWNMNFVTFHLYIVLLGECHHPNWLSLHDFLEGLRTTTNQSIIFQWYPHDILFNHSIFDVWWWDPCLMLAGIIWRWHLVVDNPGFNQFHLCRLSRFFRWHHFLHLGYPIYTNHMISWVLLIVEISTAKPKSCIILPNSREKELLNDYFHSRTFFFGGLELRNP